MIAVDKVLFKPGRVLGSPDALAALERSGESIWRYLAAHLAGDWGMVDAEDKEANDEAFKDGSRLLSAYILKSGVKIWIITEAEDDHGSRGATTVILPDEY